MERLINTTLLVLSMYLWVFRKYGIASMMNRKVSRHAAVGRAKWRAFWNVPVRDHRQGTFSASDLIASLRAERARAGYALVA
jgi:hypothetical protein